MGQGHGNVGVDQVDGGVELENRAAGKPPAGPCGWSAARKTSGRHPETYSVKRHRPPAGQRPGHDGIQADVDHGIDIARIPGRIGENLDVVSKVMLDGYREKVLRISALLRSDMLSIQ
jgi:hypothetical protein